MSQLSQVKALDTLPEVYKDVAVTRKELGTPPLVTPTSQILGVQAILNVLFGRYKMATNEVKDLVYGLYEKTPTSVDPEVRKKVLKGYKRGETSISSADSSNGKNERISISSKIPSRGSSSSSDWSPSSDSSF